MGPRWLMMVEMSTRRAVAPFNRFNPVISLFDSTSTVAHASFVLYNIYVQYVHCTLYDHIFTINEMYKNSRLLAGGPPETEEEARILIYRQQYNIEITDLT